MSFLDSRYFRLLRRADNVTELTEQFEALHATVNSMAQDIRTLHGLLEQVWPGGAENFRAHYRSGRVGVMLGDASSAGAAPYRHTALYGYTLEPEEFLAEKLGAATDDLARYRRDVEERQQYT